MYEYQHGTLALGLLLLAWLVVLVLVRRECSGSSLDNDPRCYHGTHQPSLVAMTGFDGAPPPHSRGRACAQVPVVDQINERFRLAVEPSSLLAEAGVIIHHFDTFEHPERWWDVCPANCASTYPLLAKGLLGMKRQAQLGKACRQCQNTGDRLSATSIYRGLWDPERPDRHKLTVVTPYPGIVLRPGATRLLCVYGSDGGTRRHTCPRSDTEPSEGRCIPGCGDPPHWCVDGHERLAKGCRCGFERCRFDNAKRPWKPERLGWVLREHARAGNAGQGLGSFSGYPELVVASGNGIADAVEAIFWPHTEVAGRNNQSERTACRVHRAFLRAFALDACDVPLLMLRLGDWDRPFATHWCDW